MYHNHFEAVPVCRQLFELAGNRARASCIYEVRPQITGDGPLHGASGPATIVHPTLQPGCLKLGVGSRLAASCRTALQV